MTRILRLPVSVALSLALSLALSAGLSTAAFAQDTPAPAQKEERPFNSGIGLNISLTNSGFGIGGYWQRSFSERYSLVSEFSITAGKDEKEQRFFTFFGESFIPNKMNYLLNVPLQVGVQRRLFTETIQENFRPFVVAMAGPSMGWVSPYFRDINDNEIRDGNERSWDALSAIPRGHAIFGLGGTVAVGANFGLSRKVTQGLRFGYSFIYYPGGVKLLEPQIQDATNFFGTPTISLVFGRRR